MIAATAQNDYQNLLDGIQRRFLNEFKESALFTTDAENLFSSYLESLPADARQHHTCTACRRFMESFGGLVSISPDGITIPVAWDADLASGFYRDAVRVLERIVKSAKITGVFFSSEAAWGKSITGPWTHFAITPPDSMIHRSNMQSAFQRSAEKKEDFLNVIRALEEFPLPVVEQAVTILQSEALYRSEKCLGAAMWLKELHEARKATKNSTLKQNVVWRAAASAPAGFCHPRSSMIGTLLEDIAAGLSFETISRRFAEKMHPLQYQRPQAAPSAGNIAQAERVIAQMGLAKALERRFARLDEIQTIWRPVTGKQEENLSGGIFAHLKPKGSVQEAAAILVPPQIMTWVKFLDNVIPTAAEIDFSVPAIPGNYSALLTAVHPDAPPILQWDREESRNPVSWYVYTGGSLPLKWGLQPGTHCRVTGISLHPSMWNQPAKSAHQGESVVFILDGCRDNGYEKAGNALFPETLRSELHGIRSTIEAYSRSAVIQGGDEASACGIRLQKGSPWNGMTFRVKTSSGSVLRYSLDRWD